MDLQEWASAYNQSTATGLEGFFYVTSFPESFAMAQTWDPELNQTVFHAVADEYYNKGYSMIFGPTVGPQGRTPLGGRLVETLGQDVYLAGVAFARATERIREAGVIPCGKHFLLNAQGTNRSEVYWSNNGVTVPRNNTAYTNNADDKTLHETYLCPFYDGVQAGLGAVMCAMNRVNQTFACENPELINKVLKTELAFPGFVTPDTSGQHTALGSANGGLGFGAASFWNNNTLLPALANNTLPQARLDDMAGLNNKSFPPVPAATALVDVRANHRALVSKAGGAAITLLKITNNALPLKRRRSIGVFGAKARPSIVGPGTTMDDVHNYNTWPGHLVFSGGSGMGSPSYLVTPYDALLARSIADDIPYVAVAGTAGNSAAPTFSSYAAAVETCLVFINAWSGEGNYRVELRNSDQDAMILTVAESCKNTIVIINTHPNVTAVLYASLLEGVYLEYTYFDKYNVTPRYEFRYGLSYTTFNYSAPSISRVNETALSQEMAVGRLAPGGKVDLRDEVLRVGFTLSNTGSRPGAEVAQWYLRGFRKVYLQPRETGEVAFSLRRRDLSFWDVRRQEWVVARGHRDLRGNVRYIIQ
ncbi:glycosyl hydrolase family 3 N terminal domain-containing protein [Aspergillus venezuelensis]